jgi:hypothetical protein
MLCSDFSLIQTTPSPLVQICEVSRNMLSLLQTVQLHVQPIEMLSFYPVLLK